MFYDKVLSGNRNIACATCHHPRFGTSDGLSLGIGEGGIDIGDARKPAPDEVILKRVPRNAQGLWNLGHKDVDIMFHDGRIEVSELYQNGFDTPAEEWLPRGFQTILGAQAVFPMISQFEMAGNVGENEIIGAVSNRIDYAWPLIAARISANSEYSALFVEAFDDIEASADITIVHIGEAIGQFINSEWRSLNSPYDLWRREGKPLPEKAAQGLALFMGKGNCISCHNGALFSDQEFYSIGLPIFGPGRTRKWDMIARDQGRVNASDDLADAYRFRTPSLRNITLTAPYGHNGAYPTLAGIIKHHIAPHRALENWSKEFANLPDIPNINARDFLIMEDDGEMERLRRSVDIQPLELNAAEIEAIIAFLETLTSPLDQRERLGIPAEVPSGLAVDR